MDADNKQTMQESLIGSKVKFDSDRCRYTVMAASNRFVILTKPFNAQKTYLYTIVDLEENRRGACDLIFGLPCDVDTPEGAKEALAMMDAGEMSVSRRNYVPLSEAETKAIHTMMDYTP